MNQKVFLSIFSLSTLLASCYYDVEEELYPDTSCNVPLVVSYAVDAKPIIDAKCATSGCHVDGGTGVGIMTDYAGVKAKIDDGSFSERVFQAQNMPPDGLPACELLILQAWVDQGAPEN